MRSCFRSCRTHNKSADGTLRASRPYCSSKQSFVILFTIHAIVYSSAAAIDRGWPQYGYCDIGDEVRSQNECSLQNDIANAAETQHTIFSPQSAGWPFNIVSVEWYGATGDGKTDDTQAFADAWGDACSLDSAILLVPGGKTYLLSPYNFNGPCGTSITIELAGTLIAPPDPGTWNKSDSNSWLLFSHLNNLVIEGGGVINGQGQQWWAQSCKVNKKNRCRDAPTAIKFNAIQNLKLRNLRSQDSQQIHIGFYNCYGVQLTNVTVNAPSRSPNTDGIHISATKKVLVENCTVGTGDDCVSIVSGSSDIQIKNLTCGPGHGISIGSLGKGNTEAHVSFVVVDGATLIGTSNGLRVKTWQGGSGSAIGFRYHNVRMINVSYPIIIDQYYCDSSSPCPVNQTSAVQVSHVFFHNITGTSATREAVKLACSGAAPCNNIVLERINLTMASGTPTTSTCESAGGAVLGSIIPSACLDRTDEDGKQGLDVMDVAYKDSS